MKKQKFLALALAMAVVAGTVVTTTFVANAAPYTQAQTPAQVHYGTLSQQELAIVDAHFDAEFYAAKYDDVVEALGIEPSILKEHFVKCGIFEGREGWASFNASAYSSAYSDLKDEYGHDVVKYFVHYYTKGINEGRNLTTIDACKKAGIRVISLFDEDALVSANIYAASNLMGTNDYHTVEQAVNSVSENNAAIVNTNEGSYAVVTEEDAKEIIKKNPELEVVGSFSVNGDKECVVLVHRNSNGYSTSFANDVNGQDLSDVIAFIPSVAFTVEEANNIIRNEPYAISPIEPENGVVMGTEGVTFSDDYKFEFHQPDEFEAPNKRVMTNYVDAQYKDNAPIGVDEKGDADTEYTVSAGAVADEDGNARVTVEFSNDENDYLYHVTYTFQDKNE